MDVHEVATRRTNKTFIQNKTIILKLECTINNESIYSLNDYVHIIREGLLCVEMEENLSSGYDLVFYSEFENQEALKDFQNHPLHEAHKKRCKDLVCKRLCGDIERK